MMTSWVTEISQQDAYDLPGLGFEVVRVNTRPILLLSWIDSQVSPPEQVKHLLTQVKPLVQIASAIFDYQHQDQWGGMSAKVRERLDKSPHTRVVLLAMDRVGDRDPLAVRKDIWLSIPRRLTRSTGDGIPRR